MSAVSGTASSRAGTDPRPPGAPASRSPAASQRAVDLVPPGSVPASRAPGAERSASRAPAAERSASSGPSPRAPGRRRPITAAACRVFAAQPVQIAHARRFIAGVLSGFGAAEDIVLCVCELASNAVLHSCSREPGGQFTVRVSVSPGGRIRAEVVDRGGPWGPEPAQDEEHGRGLLIVAALATRWGVTGSEAGRSAWLELDPPAPGPVIS
jgi:serine/threonine-protein kinase RsbW